MKVKLIYGLGYQVFMEKDSYEFKVSYEEGWENLINVFLKLYPQAKKTNILELLEYVLMCVICSENRLRECDEILWFPLSKDSKGYGKNGVCFNEPIPSFESEYISILGELFLAGYVDFVAEEEIKEKEYKDVYLSEYKANKYEAWKYFRDNYFYKYAFQKFDDEDILIYNGKEYSVQDCPRYYNKKEKMKIPCGYSTMYSPTSWDTPKHWSQYNIWVTRTQKGTKYFNEILSPRFYNKYKDLEVEIDSQGNVIRWIGQINR